MARQLTDLEQIFSNELADDDFLLVRDKSARTDKKITVEALRVAFESALSSLAFKDTVDTDDIDDGAVTVGKTDFIVTDPNIQYVLVVGDIQIIAGANNAVRGGTAVTFKKPFGSTPAITCTTRDPNNQTGWFSAISSTSVTLRQLYEANSLQVNWIAIGKKGNW